MLQRYPDANANRINIFNVFPRNEDDEEDREPEALSPISTPKIADLHEWLTTSYYGTIKNKPGETIIPIEPTYFDETFLQNGPMYNMTSENGLENMLFLLFSCDETSGHESNSLLQEKIRIEKDSITIRSYEYGLCKKCKSRYTRHRTTFYFRIAWLIFSSIILTIAIFPWGLLSIICLTIIPTQVRRPLCKKCRETTWI